MISSLYSKSVRGIYMQDKSLEMVFWDAIYDNDAKKMEELIQNGYDVTHPQEGMFVPLISSVIYGSGDVFKVLVENGAPINTVGTDNKTAMDIWNEFKDRNDPRQMRIMIDLLRQYEARTGKAQSFLNQSLLRAVQKADLKTYKELLQRGARLNFGEEESENALIQAFNSKDMKFFRTVLKEATNKDINNPVVRPFLNYVVQNNQIKGIQEFLKAKGDICFQDEAGETLLTKAVRDGHIEMAGALASLGVDMDLKDNQGLRPIDWALKQNMGEMFVVLLNAECTKKGHLNIQEPVTKAIEEGYDNIIEYLLKAEAPLVENGDASLLLSALKPFEEDHSYIYSKEKKPLHRPKEIVTAGRKKIAKLLIEAGADLNQKDGEGNTSLILATQNGYSALLPLMIEKGADIHAKNNKGLTAFQIALSENLTQSALMLLDAGEDVNNGGETNFTPLMRIALSRNVPLAQELIVRGADVNVINIEGKTAAMMAAENGNWPMVKCFLDAGLDPSCCNKEGKNLVRILGDNMSIIPDEDIPAVNAFFASERAKEPKPNWFKQVIDVVRGR